MAQQGLIRQGFNLLVNGSLNLTITLIYDSKIIVVVVTQLRESDVTQVPDLGDIFFLCLD